MTACRGCSRRATSSPLPSVLPEPFGRVIDEVAA
jgi:hypothetical protein